jgi:hypothetical protein
MPAPLFQKGNQTGKLKAGQTHKMTKDLRLAIANFCEKQFEQIELDFMTLSPKERCQLFAALVQYVVPKKQTLEIESQHPINERFLSLTFEQLEEIEAKGKPVEIGN